jgi:hypothetical protein
MVFRSASELKARRPRARWLAAAKALAMLLVRVSSILLFADFVLHF